MRARVWIGAAALVAVVVVVGAALAAREEWPNAHLADSDDALTRVVVPGMAGKLEAVDVSSADGAKVPVQLRGDSVWPQAKLASGARVTVELTVRRPGWAGWLVGGTEHRSFTVVTPTAHLEGRWLQMQSGSPVAVTFDKPVSVVAFNRAKPKQLPSPATVVRTGVVAHGKHSAGAVKVAAAARSWELVSEPVRVSWFPAKPYPQVLAQPTPGALIGPERQLTLSFSSPIHEVLGTRLPRLSPALPGRWRLLDEHTLAFQPRGLGYALGSTVTVQLPRAAHLAGKTGTTVTRTLQWRIPPASTLRLQQLLAQLGYLPVDWEPSGDPSTLSARKQLFAAITPPVGHFVWRFRNTPKELRSLWTPGEVNEITRGAIMKFERRHDLTVDGLAGPAVWQALIADAIAGKRITSGYSYVFVHRSLPQSLNLWHNGKVIVSSPGNTGVPAAPTALGTFPVFEHIPTGTMSGTNPDGTHYNDPGIRFISYFHHGEAIHAFNRASFGTPQSLGCVELPLAAAAKVWPYTPIGTLVTIEN